MAFFVICKNSDVSSDMEEIKMIEGVKFQNFRGFSYLQMESVKPITLISGMNNVGKSSILDGLFLFFDHTAPECFVKLNSFRGSPSLYDPRYLWEPVFNNLNTGKNMEIELVIDGSPAVLKYSRDDAFVFSGNTEIPQNVIDQFVSSVPTSYTLEFDFKFKEYYEKGHFITSSTGLLRNMETSINGNKIKPLSFTKFINSLIVYSSSELANWIGNLELSGRKEELVKILQLIEPSISDITTIMTGSGGAQIYARMNGQLLPVKLAGDGFNKWMYIILSIMAHPNSLILIDEIETGIHYSAYVNLWKVIALTAQKYNCQVIATTHSYECIRAAVESIEESGRMENFCYFRIDREREGHVAYRYSDDLLKAAINTNLEVR